MKQNVKFLKRLVSVFVEIEFNLTLKLFYFSFIDFFSFKLYEAGY